MIMSGINPKDFSVIIQGPVIGSANDTEDKQLTVRCIKSIRQHLPGAEIIISTWEGHDVSYLDYDHVVFNTDPGSISYNDFKLKNVYNNNNRQITTTYNGLKLATRKYAVKMRGDFYLKNAGFIEYLDKYPETNKYKFFSSRILVPTYFFRDPEKAPVLFHISDLFMVGHTADLINLWDIPLQPEPETTRAFDYSVQFANDPFKSDQFKMRYASEQYIWYAFSKKMGLDLSLNYFCEVPTNRISDAIISTIDNFLVLSIEQMGIDMPDRLKHWEKQLYTFKKWELLYNSLCIKKSKLRLLQAVIVVKLVSARYTFKNLKRTLKGKNNF